MREERNYWTRLAERRLSRRRLLAGAAGLGAAAVALSACGGEEKPAAQASPGATPAPAGTPEIGSVTLVPAKTRGGTARWYGYEALPLDTLDPHQTQFGPIYDMHAVVFSKLLKYENVYNGVISADLAESIPEVVDGTTYVVKIRRGATFHDTPAIRDNLKDIAPNLPGRELTAEDVKYSIERQVDRTSPKSALYYRASQWDTVDRIDVVDPYTLRITTKKPTAPFIHFMADSNAFIIAKELVDAAKEEMNDIKRMVGTGPFIVHEFAPLRVSKAVRNPTWFAKDDLAAQGLPDRPIVDSYEVLWILADETAMEASFRSKQIDGVGSDDHSTAERIARELGLKVILGMTSGFVNSRLLVADSAAAETPFKDLRLRKAVHLSIDRNRMRQQMFKGSGYLAGPVTAAIRKWAMPLPELVKRPGYRFGTQDRQEDLAEARKLWEAGGGSAVDSVHMVYTSIPAYISDFFPQFQGMLKEVLGLDVSGELDTTGYTVLAQGFVEKRLLLSLAYDNGWNDLDDWTYPYFRTGGPKNSFNLSDPELDRMLDAQRAEFDEEARKKIGLDIQDYLLENTLAMLNWCAPGGAGVEWPYVHNSKEEPWFGNSFHRANLWLDSSDPSWQGRPA